MDERFNNIKAIALDIDGTLIDYDHTLPFTIETLAKARKKGFLIGLATGRDIKSVIDLLPKWNLHNGIDFIVGSGGAEIMNFNTNEFKCNYPLSIETIKYLINYVKDIEDIGFGFPIDGKLTTFIDNQAVIKMAIDDGVGYQIMPLEEMLKHPTTKLVFYGNENNVHLLENRIKSLPQSREYHILYTGQDSFEAMDLRISKSNGLKMLLKDFNLSLDNCLAFGDQDNDIDMLNACAIGVCMANGSLNTKKSADYITDSNSEDGIAKFLNKYLLI